MGDEGGKIFDFIMDKIKNAKFVVEIQAHGGISDYDCAEERMITKLPLSYTSVEIGPPTLATIFTRGQQMLTPFRGDGVNNPEIMRDTHIYTQNQQIYNMSFQSLSEDNSYIYIYSAEMPKHKDKRKASAEGIYPLWSPRSLCGCNKIPDEMPSNTWYPNNKKNKKNKKKTLQLILDGSRMCYHDIIEFMKNLSVNDGGVVFLSISCKPFVLNYSDDKKLLSDVMIPPKKLLNAIVQVAHSQNRSNEARTEGQINTKMLGKPYAKNTFLFAPPDNDDIPLVIKHAIMSQDGIKDLLSGIPFPSVTDGASLKEVITGYKEFAEQWKNLNILHNDPPNSSTETIIPPDQLIYQTVARLYEAEMQLYQFIDDFITIEPCTPKPGEEICSGSYFSTFLESVRSIGMEKTHDTRAEEEEELRKLISKQINMIDGSGDKVHGYSPLTDTLKNILMRKKILPDVWARGGARNLYPHSIAAKHKKKKKKKKKSKTRRKMRGKSSKRRKIRKRSKRKYRRTKRN